MARYSFPPPNFPICQNEEKQQSTELATPSNDRVQNLPCSKKGRVQNLPQTHLSSGLCQFFFSWGGTSFGLCHFRGWPVQDSVVFLHSGTWGNKGVARIAGHPVPALLTKNHMKFVDNNFNYFIQYNKLGNGKKVTTVFFRLLHGRNLDRAGPIQAALCAPK